MNEERTAKRKSPFSAARYAAEIEVDSPYTLFLHNTAAAVSDSLSPELTKRPHIELFGTNHKPIQTKRKQSHLDESAGLTEQIKRFRITNTPGELR